MSLQFVFGNSGSGKSEYLYEHILEQAAAEPERNFLVLVPEQFTMQTQRELVERQSSHAIMNVDVLSFARLAYRVFDELGKQNLIVLEETGKNLVLRKVAEQKRGELPMLGSSMNKMGYVGEIKSLISEMTQYNVSPEDLERFLESECVGEAVRYKLKDILTLYRGFREYIEGAYITAEEVLALLCEVAKESALLRDCVIVFDEFTGFTPIQNRVLRELLCLAQKVMVSVTVDIREDVYHSRGIHELFAMSKKTVRSLQKMASELAVETEEPVVLTAGEKKRYAGAPALFFMEQNLFRARAGQWRGETESIRLAAAKNPREELTFAAREITRLVREQGYCYKDIAVVTGDVPGYANYVPEIFRQYGIPYFVDQTRNILFHPFVEFVRAALEVVEYDFSYESVFRFLRCGLFLGDEETDILENFVRAKGIRGRKRWGERWRAFGKEEAEGERRKRELDEINELRERVSAAFEPLSAAFSGSGHSAAEQTYALFRFIEQFGVEERLKRREQSLIEEGERLQLAQEYAQIYRIVMDLLDKVYALLGDERLGIREYSDILDAGFEAAKVGIIPPGNDRVTIGDIERTRLNHIRILFFVGVNDGVVPKLGNPGGIISQFEREMMAEHHLELAPLERERVFIQKFYLYLNMTKPSDRLYVTYSMVNSDGKSLRSSYLLGTLQHMFPDLVTAKPAETECERDVLTPENGIRYLLAGLRRQDCGGQAGEAPADFADAEDENGWNADAWYALAQWYLSREPYRGEVCRLFDAAFGLHADTPIGRAAVRALYGAELENSVTRLERFAACAFSHFLDYGLQLREREEYGFASVDMGNIYHDALEHFARRVDASEYTWFDIPQELQEQWVEESMEDAILGNPNAGVCAEARSRYLLTQMKATMRKTVWALITQVQKGQFTPREFEVSFSRADNLAAVRFSLSEEEKMRLKGRIDRVDTYETEDKVYVRIIDYKSGNTSFSLLNLYHGLQLQLVVYMNAALELEQKKHPAKQVMPAGIFYYHIANPMVEGQGTESEEEIKQSVLAQLALNGLVNADSEIYRAMDADFTGSSSVIPVSLKADGTPRANSKLADSGEFALMADYVNKKLLDAGKKIMAGDVSVSPYQLDEKRGCDYCPYHTVCGFDSRIPGYAYRRLEKFGRAEEIFAAMQEGGLS